MPKLTRADRRLLVTTVAFVVSQANIVRVLGPTARTVGRVQTAWSADAYRRAIGALDERGRAAYREHYLWDLVHPALFAVALRAGADALVTHRSMPARVRTALRVAPVVAAAADYVENGLGLYLLARPDRIDDTTVRVGTVVSTTKWVLALGAFGYLAQGFARSGAGALLGGAER